MFFLLLFWAEILHKLEKHTGDRMDEATQPLCVWLIFLPRHRLKQNDQGRI